MLDNGKYLVLINERPCPFKERGLNMYKYYDDMYHIIHNLESVEFKKQLELVPLQDLDISIILYELLLNNNTAEFVQHVIEKYSSRPDFSRIVNYTIHSNNLYFDYHIDLLLEWIEPNCKFINDYVSRNNEIKKVNFYKSKKDQIVQYIKENKYGEEELIVIATVSLFHEESDIVYLLFGLKLESENYEVKLESVVSSLTLSITHCIKELTTLIRLRPKLRHQDVKKILENSPSLILLELLVTYDYIKFNDPQFAGNKLRLLLKEEKYDYKVMEQIASIPKINMWTLLNVIRTQDMKLITIFKDPISKINTKNLIKYQSEYLTVDILKLLQDSISKDPITKQDINNLLRSGPKCCELIEFIYENKMCKSGITYESCDLTTPCKQDSIYVFKLMMNNGAKLTGYIKEYLREKTAPTIKEYLKKEFNIVL